MVTYLSMVLGHMLSWLAFAAVAVYAGIVLMRYRTDGPHYRVRFELQYPGRSLQQLLVWLGVKILEGCIRISSALFNVLLEASAEVGEWFIRLNPTMKESVRSRFLV